MSTLLTILLCLTQGVVLPILHFLDQDKILSFGSLHWGISLSFCSFSYRGVYFKSTSHFGFQLVSECL